MPERLTQGAVAVVDREDLLSDILTMPDHIADAMWRAQSAFLVPAEARSLVICGMGGSAIGADLAAAVIGPLAKGPIVTNRGYDLPSWVGPQDAVVLSSYSGSTEETLSCFEQARAVGAKLFVVSSGGPISEAAHADGIPVIGLPGIFQPRAAVAYGVVSVVEIAIACGIAPPELRKELAAAAASLPELATSWAPDGEDALARRLASEAQGSLIVIYGAELTAPVAYRWRCQINENAKFPAYEMFLPEANHNEICGWEGAGEISDAVCWFLADPDQHPRIADRTAAAQEIILAAGNRVETIAVPGESRTERIFALVLLGDLVSLYLAVLRGVDPTPVGPIENLKDRLGRPTSAG